MFYVENYRSELEVLSGRFYAMRDDNISFRKSFLPLDTNINASINTSIISPLSMKPSVPRAVVPMSMIRQYIHCIGQTDTLCLVNTQYPLFAHCDDDGAQWC